MPATLAPSTLAELERRLHRERDRLRRLAAVGWRDLSVANDIDVSDLFDEDGPTVPEPAERHRATTLIRHASEGDAAVDRALERLAAGTYGTCRGCQQRIPVARLRAVPTAERCAPCTAAADWPLGRAS